MKARELIWVVCETHFGNEWRAPIYDILSGYHLRIDRHVGQPVIHDLKGVKRYFNNIQESKDWCQVDFDKVVANLFCIEELEFKDFGSDIHKAEIEGINSNYVIFLDRINQKWKVNQLTRKITIHDSFDSAKEWCNKNFKETIRLLINQL